jgi:O-acetyl-ADP-ribose deacetylase (regulator of RNase III)
MRLRQLRRGAAVLPTNTLVGVWRTSALRIEVHLTPCIVTSPPGGSCGALVNPANERLAGTRFTPGECARYLAAGTNLLYPPQVIDGLVHGARGDSSGDGAGAAALAAAIAALPVVAGSDVRCVTGGAVATAAFGELSECYSTVVHTCPPFFGADDWQELLRSCYARALAVAEERGASTVAVPLLGAGARGAPECEACDVAADAVASWVGTGGLHLARFGVQDDGVAQTLAYALDAASGGQGSR